MLEQRARVSRPLVALLKWLTTLRRPSASCRTRTAATRGARSASGRQNAAYDEDRRSTTTPEPAASRTTGSITGRQSRRPCRARAARCPGEPVGRDPVGGGAPGQQGRLHRQPARGASTGRGVERCRRRGGRRRRRCRRCRRASRRQPGQLGVAGHGVGLRRAEAQHPRRLLRLRGGQGLQVLDHRAALLGQRRERQPVEVERLAPAGDRLALRGRQQDQHAHTLGAGGTPRTRARVPGWCRGGP